MNFPSSPTNGQTATVNNIVYTYNSANTTWTRTPSAIAFVDISASGNITTTGYVSAAGNVTGGNILTAGVVSATGKVLSTVCRSWALCAAG